MTPTVRRALAAVIVALIVGQLAVQRLLHRAPLPAIARSGVTQGRTASVASAARHPESGTLSMGQLTLHHCAIGGRQSDGLPSITAWCVSVPVPEDWDHPHARHILLAVAVVPAQTASASPDLATFLDGGPGGAAREDYPTIAAALAPLRERHAILLVDQRGTGSSNPLDCAALSEPATKADSMTQAPSRAATSAATQLARDESDNAQEIARRLRSCLDELAKRAAPQFYTTTAAVRDLEAVRQALGAPPLDLIGISYGTRVAQQFAARYPYSVRSVVLDSPVPNRLALLSEHARNLEHALQLLFGECRANAACAARFGDSYATLYQLRDRLRSAPVPVTLPDPVTYAPLHVTLTASDLADVVRFDAYNGLTAALLPLMLSEAQRGNYAPLLGQKTLLASDLADQITSGEELSVLCAEDVDLLTPRPEDDSSLLGNDAITRAQAACRLWPRGSRPSGFHAPFQSQLPVLVLDGQLDPVTPPAYGAEIVQALPHARRLVVAGQGHGVIGAGCMPRLVRSFVETLDSAHLDASCLQRLGPIPAFLDYNGAPP